VVSEPNILFVRVVYRNRYAQPFLKLYVYDNVVQNRERGTTCLSTNDVYGDIARPYVTILLLIAMCLLHQHYCGRVEAPNLTQELNFAIDRLVHFFQQPDCKGDVIEQNIHGYS